MRFTVIGLTCGVPICVLPEQLKLDEVSTNAQGQQLDLGKKAHVRINASLTKICNVVRKMQLESSLMQDRSRMQQQMAGVSPSRVTSSVGSSRSHASSITEDVPRDSYKANYGFHHSFVQTGTGVNLSRYLDFARTYCHGQRSFEY